ncbi:MAG: hypothetical protein DRR19_27730 [Candidatus Parabeggiatoa sp. nov. 1]|nr:MAG: hypothetical protein DRR19_27730 [Gammaproteobacteria bacterium]
MKRATLSVLTPNYNHAKYIGEAIEAVVSQSRQPDEYIILDDASTDNSLEIIEQYASQYSFIKVFQNSENKGVIYSLNRLVELASGEYIYGGAADDKILPGFLEKSMQMLENYPQAALCCAIPASLDEETGVIVNGYNLYPKEGGYLSPEQLMPLIRATNFWIATHTVIQKRSSLSSVWFLPELKWSSDWFAHLVAAARQGICFIPEPLAIFRVTGNNYCLNLRNWQEQKPIIQNIIEYIESPTYQDTRNFFVRSGVLKQVPGPYGLPGIFFLAPRNLKYSRYLTHNVVLYGIIFLFKKLLKKVLPRRFIVVLKNFKYKLKSNP